VADTRPGVSGAAFTRTPAFDRLSDYPAHWGRQSPAGDAVVEGGRVLNHAAFDLAIAAAARGLLASGVRHGDRVAVMATPCTEHLVLFIAATRIGAIWLGLNPRYRLGELHHVLGDARPRLIAAMGLIEGRDYADDWAALPAEVMADTTLVALRQPLPLASPWDAFLGRGQSLDECVLAEATARVQADDPALIVYTSGSTGAPKGAMLSHRAIVTTARIQCEHWWAEPIRILNNTPINHVAGAVQIACHAIVAGGANVLAERFDPVDLPALIRERDITVTHQVATMYQMLLDKGRPTREDLASLQVLIWSGSPAPRALIERLRGFGASLYTSYGQTESCGEVLYTPEGADDEVLALTVGLPDEHIAVRLGDDAGSGPAEGTHGEIQVRGPTVMNGYFAQAEATRQAFTADGWLRTGDMGERRPDGLFRITGRLKEMFKSGGYSVYPREVELVLERHPGVAMAAVLGVPDATFGEVGHAWVLATEPAPRVEDIDQFCRQHMANYKVPKRIHVEAALPMLPIGKIDKVALRRIACPSTP